jgi:hypothetical protein
MIVKNVPCMRTAKEFGVSMVDFKCSNSKSRYGMHKACR